MIDIMNRLLKFSFSLLLIFIVGETNAQDYLKFVADNKNEILELRFRIEDVTEEAVDEFYVEGEYSVDGNDWEKFSFTDKKNDLALSGTEILLRTHRGDVTKVYGNDVEFSVVGPITSICKNGNYTSIFSSLKNLTDASALIIPDKLSEDACKGMFYKCIFVIFLSVYPCLTVERFIFL